MDDPLLRRLVPALAAVPGVDAVVLGGSRSRGDAVAGSDYDIGLYFRARTPLDVGALKAAVAPFVDAPSEGNVTEIGEWGPWIVGGGWLTIDGQSVDLLYRNVDDVVDTIARARNGVVEVDYQPGHPHGFLSSIWLAEVHHCRILADRSGTVSRMKQGLTPYPRALGEAIVARFQWEIAFAAGNAAKAIARNDMSYIAGSIFRALACAAQVICAINGACVMNEKGALRLAGTLPLAPRDLEGRVETVWACFADKDYAAALDALNHIDRDVARLVEAWREAG